MAYIQAISYYLPAESLTNAQLNQEFPEWSVDKITEKTGIANRWVAGADEYVSDMAVHAAEHLFESYGIRREDIDFVLLCTQSADYFLPATACLVQERLGIPTTAGAMDFNQGCSGYIYGLALAAGLIRSGDANRVLLITSETYSKYLRPNDKTVRTLFGDAASATLVSSEGPGGRIGGCIFGTDGAGAGNLIVKGGAGKFPGEPRELYMNGPDVFAFTLKRVPGMVSDVLSKNDLKAEDVDLFVFHQANKFMLDHLRTKLGLPEEKCFLYLQDCGNTVSSTIPIAIREAQRQGLLEKGKTALLGGFGVGYSWGATILKF